MLSLGIMALSLNSESTYFKEIAKRAHQYGIECFRFVPSQINPQTQLITGERFNQEKQDWAAAEFHLPKILYDRCFYGDDAHSRQCIPIVTWLKSRKDVTFLGYGLPNKLELYEELAKSELAPYLPPTKPVETAEKITEELNRMRKLILKPINGSQGNGIYYLEKRGKEVFIKTEKQGKCITHTFPDTAKTVAWLRQLTNRKKYLLQPYLSLTDPQSRPFDIRILLQKDENGKWQERGRGIRTGKNGGILSNISAGADVTDFASWLETVDAPSKQFISEELTDILAVLPAALEEVFLPLFEIGVDIGIAKDRGIWILDINSKPGRKVIFATNPELKETLYSAPLLYGITAAKTNWKERKKSYEKTLSN